MISADSCWSAFELHCNRDKKPVLLIAELRHEMLSGGLTYRPETFTIVASAKLCKPILVVHAWCCFLDMIWICMSTCCCRPFSRIECSLMALMTIMVQSLKKRLFLQHTCVCCCLISIGSARTKSSHPGGRSALLVKHASVVVRARW